MAISEFSKYDLSRALDSALAGLDAPYRRAFTYHLQKKYELKMAELNLEQIEDTLTDMFGAAAGILLRKIYVELGDSQVPEKSSILH
jgi:hypothetical protein